MPDAARSLPRDWLSYQQVSERLHVTVRTLRTYVRDGRLSAVSHGRYRFITERAVEDFLDQREREAQEAREAAARKRAAARAKPGRRRKAQASPTPNDRRIGGSEQERAR